jgi:hypothetical protein
MVRNFWLTLFTTIVVSMPAFVDDAILLRPDQVFTAEDSTVHPGWELLVEGNLIKAVGQGSLRQTARGSYVCPERRCCPA